MKNKTEQFWEDRERKILHIRVDEVRPLMENYIEVCCTVLEDDEQFCFEARTEE